LTWFFMQQASKGKKYFIRRIAGLDVLDEALQRATELGGTVNFSVGDRASLSGILVSQTIAGFEILGHVARYCGKMRTKLVCSIVGRSGSGGELVPIQAEIIRDAFAAGGAEEDFNVNMVVYLAGDSAGYETSVYDFYKSYKVTTNVLIGAFAGKAATQPTFIAKALGIINIT